ncbi:putative prolycopene isomerase [Helianthus anomalus]
MAMVFTVVACGGVVVNVGGCLVLVAATQLAMKGAKVLVLEKYVIPGGSSGFYE